MKIGISFYYGFKSAPIDRAKLLRKNGFHCVIANADPKFNQQNSNIKRQIKLFKGNNIELSSLHMRYNRSELPNFWKKGLKGHLLMLKLKKDVKIAKKYGFRCVVVHLVGKYSKIGEKRLISVLKLCEKLNIPLAIENLSDLKIFEDVFKNIQSPYLKFCYDAGHNNAFNKEFDVLSAYSEKLITLHLHDNNGETDQHTLNRFGSIDWDAIAKKLAKTNIENLDYEIFNPNGLDEQNFLKEVKYQGEELAKKIESYRKKLAN